ncbi:MAG TPA: NUDIX hydrolase [Puia sp.]|jgi:ADP-ribose pyrophosphatase|nr:NUDIX hydrolase [Puia sp.]
MRDLRWKKISSQYISRDQWGTVRKDICQTPDGKIIDPYFVYEFPTWVTAVAITEEGKVILERQYRYALDVTCYEIPGGCVDETDSSLEMAIERELLEETGYKFTNYEYLGKTSSNPSTNNNWMHMYLATGGRYEREQQLDHNEDIEVYLFTVDEVKKLLEENQIIQSMHVTTLYYAFTKMKFL